MTWRDKPLAKRCLPLRFVVVHLIKVLLHSPLVHVEGLAVMNRCGFGKNSKAIVKYVYQGSYFFWMSIQSKGNVKLRDKVVKEEG